MRRDGYATTWEELDDGLCSTAAPVRGGRGTVIAAISVSAPTVRTTRKRLAELSEHVVEAANALTLYISNHKQEGNRSCMTHDEILTQLYDRTLVGDKPTVLELTNQGLEAGLGPEQMLFDALIPGPRGGGRPLRARRLLRPRDADRRPGDERRAGDPAPAPRRHGRRDRSARF